jgi:hypothetical protein
LQKDMVLAPDPPDWQLKLTPVGAPPGQPAPPGAAARPQ